MLILHKKVSLCYFMQQWRMEEHESMERCQHTSCTSEENSNFPLKGGKGTEEIRSILACFILLRWTCLPLIHQMTSRKLLPKKRLCDCTRHWKTRLWSPLLNLACYKWEVETDKAWHPSNKPITLQIALQLLWHTQGLKRWHYPANTYWMVLEVTFRCY